MIFRHRKIFCLSLFAVLAVFAAEALPHAIKFPMVWCLLSGALLLLLLSLRVRRLLTVALALLLATLACLSSAHVSGERNALIPIDEKELSVSVTVEHVTKKGENSTSFQGKAYLITDDGVVRARVTGTAKEAVDTGDILTGHAVFYLAEENSYSESQGFHGHIVFKEQI